PGTRDGVATLGARLIREVDKRRRHEVDADDLDRDRETCRQAGDDEPPPAPDLEVPEQGGDSEGREERAVPGGHRSRVVRHAPGHGGEANSARLERAQESRRDVVERRHPCDEEREEHEPERRQLLSEQEEGAGVEIAEGAGVRVDEVPMWKLAVEDPVSRLGERPFVPWIPTPVEPEPEIERAADRD